ncbi:hypothetical protein EU244_012840 [Rhodococcus qingshengii]|uniref:hypothetical protein n=1 Tax=Rhodococcus qingshengii TaxID=334542 RepID=UPI0010A5E2AF|nr:hypothetical protein [Rhodococcus qingshengii]THJ69985.1 hypothetical protein EU244_20210 [Rhodococcus qingshengii]
MSTALNFPIEPVRSAITDGLLEAADVIKQEAIERAPKETGYLRNTAATAAEGLTSAVGFDGPYAVIQHEALDFNHQDGEAKFLENACIAKKDVVAAILAEAIRRSIG